MHPIQPIGILSCLEDECVSLKQGDANINLIGLDEKSLADETLKNMMEDIHRSIHIRQINMGINFVFI